MNKEKMWKTIAIIACSLLLIIVATSFTPAVTSQYYDICKELEDLELKFDALNMNLTFLETDLSSINSTLNKIYIQMVK